MTRWAFLLLACAACGGASPDTRAVVPAQPETRPAPLAEPKEEQRTTLEYVVVPMPWVEKVAPAPAADVKAWAAAPENKDAAAGRVRAMVFVDDGDGRKRATRAIARLAKGEGYAKVRSDLEQDIATRCDTLEDEIRAAGASLAQGAVSKDPIASKCGLLIVACKDAANEDELAAAYKHAKADGLAKKLAEEILARMRTADSTRAAIAGAVESVLGEDAKENADRPQAQLVVDKHLERLHLSAEAKAGLAELAKTGRTGQVASAPIGSKNAWVAARVANAPPR